MVRVGLTLFTPERRNGLLRSSLAVLHEFHRLRAAGYPELLEDLADVAAHRDRRDREAIRDLRRREAVVQALEGLPLAVSQLHPALAHQRPPAALATRAELLDQP